MDASYYVDDKKRTIIKASAGYDIAEQRIRIYAPNGDVFDLYGDYPNFGTVSFAIEDRPEQFISCYPNGTAGRVAVALEQRFQLFGNYTSWSEQEKYEIYYPINANEWTRPSIDSLSYSPSEELLDTAGLYVKGRNGITVSELTASGKLGASVVDIKWYIEGVSSELYSAGDTSVDLRSYGRVPITFIVTDSRGIVTSRTDYVTVHDYYKPYVSPVSGYDRIIAARTDTSGIFMDGGTLLRVEAGKRYADVGGLNKCRLMYRIKAAAEGWSDYVDLLSESSEGGDYAGNVGITLDSHTVYKFELVVLDSFGEWEAVMFDLLTEEVYMYRSGTRRSIAFGGHVTKDDAFEVYWGAHFYGGVSIEPLDGVAGIVIGSSTAGSDKKFLLTVNDSGTLSVSEYKN